MVKKLNNQHQTNKNQNTHSNNVENHIPPVIKETVSVETQIVFQQVNVHVPVAPTVLIDELNKTTEALMYHKNRSDENEGNLINAINYANQASHEIIYQRAVTHDALNAAQITALELEKTKQENERLKQRLQALESKPQAIQFIPVNTQATAQVKSLLGIAPKAEIPQIHKEQAKSGDTEPVCLEKTDKTKEEEINQAKQERKVQKKARQVAQKKAQAQLQAQAQKEETEKTNVKSAPIQTDIATLKKQFASLTHKSDNDDTQETITAKLAKPALMTGKTDPNETEIISKDTKNTPQQSLTKKKALKHNQKKSDNAKTIPAEDIDALIAELKESPVQQVTKPKTNEEKLSLSNINTIKNILKHKDNIVTEIKNFIDKNTRLKKEKILGIIHDNKIVLEYILQNSPSDDTKNILSNLDLGAFKEDKKSLLITASYNGHTEIIAGLLGDISETDRLQALNSKTVMDITPLHTLSYYRYTQTVQVLLNGLSEENRFQALNAKTKDNKTPLHLATEQGHSDIVQILLNDFSEENRLKLLNAKDITGTTALHIATEQGHTEIVQTLLNSIPEEHRLVLLQIENNNEESPLHVAIDKEHTEIVKILLKSIPQSDDRLTLLKINDSDGYNPLHLATEKGHTEIVEILLNSVSTNEKSELLNTRTSDGYDPLELAIEHHHNEIVDMLINSISDTHKPEFKDIQT